MNFMDCFCTKNKIHSLIKLNAFISQIAVSFIFTFIESLFLEIGEELLIKILPLSIFDDEVFLNRSFVFRLREITIYDASQINILIWTSIIGAYFLNKFGQIKNLLIFYSITIISLICTIFLPYNETNKDHTIKEISESKIKYNKVIYYLIILIALSISVGNYNLTSLQYIVCEYDAKKGFLIPYYVGLGCLVKYIYIRAICNIWEDEVREFQKPKNYQKFLLLIIIFIIICLFISFYLTYKIEIEITLLKINYKGNSDLLNLSKKKIFKEDVYKLYFGKKYKNSKNSKNSKDSKNSTELKYFFWLNLISKFEKIKWKQIINLNLYKLEFEFARRLVNLVFIFLSFIIGYIHDKHDHSGFKIFLNSGNLINIIISFIYIFIHNQANDIVKISLSYINMFFVGNYYAIMLPELIKKFGKRFILEISGFIGLSNLISRIIELYFLLNRGENKGFYFIMILQLSCSVISIIIIQLELITRNQYQNDLEDQIYENNNEKRDTEIDLKETGLKNSDNSEI